MPIDRGTEDLYKQSINNAQMSVNDAQKNVNDNQALVSQYQQQADDYKQQYESAQADAKNYESIYNEVRSQYTDTEAIKNLKTTYEKALEVRNNAKKSVDMANATIQNLPAAIRGSFADSTASSTARQRALYYQQSKWQNSLNVYNTAYNNLHAAYERDYANYNKAYEQGIQEAKNVATGTYQQQEAMLDRMGEDWRSMLVNRAEAEEAYQNSQTMLSNAREYLAQANSALSKYYTDVAYADERKRQFEASMAEQRRQFDEQLSYMRSSYQNLYNLKASQAAKLASDYANKAAQLQEKINGYASKGLTTLVNLYTTNLNNMRSRYDNYLATYY